uniref:DNA recombination and repair protein Rad51-like C-terminal domain-containing protein n=1 Tax=Arcella intermedia TaxID=1963864 RepID=A0A6B2LKH3_9EUKA
MMSMMVHCVLPLNGYGVVLSGREESVLFFDLDYKFDFKRFVELLKNRIGRNCRQQGVDLGEREFLDIVRSSLSRFNLCRCVDQLEFGVSLKALSSRPTIPYKSIFIDSLDCYFWQERTMRSRRGGYPINTLLTLLKRLQREKEANIIMTVSEFFNSSGPTLFLSNQTLKIGDKTIPFQIDPTEGLIPN